MSPYVSCIIMPPSRHQDLMQSLSHMNTTTGVFDKHNVVVQRMINMTRHIILRIMRILELLDF